MITVRVTQIIGRSPAEVYAVLGCYDNDPRWRTGVLAMKQDSPGPPRVNMRTHETMLFMGKKEVFVADIVVAEPDRRTAFRTVSGPVKAWGQRLFEPHPAGTRFTYEAHVELEGVMKLLSPLVRLLFRQQMKKDLFRAKKLVEGEKTVAGLS